ncbi:MAG: MBL fold metallo-hydrolase [Butyrivibrio sp.]|uniref:MBL fold metallo-hydrolase n=1 Tax=Butyrivibrio sp. TaxID=28121 RepID=UPI001B1D6725|nr:MBL fold metallo-hydrolase [Butyrivibrio sp.]MBO6240889.1 MBL fold metallo-hydrolase [Butyrivibrio sp.]
MNESVKRILDTNTPFGTASMWWLGQMGLMVKMGEIVFCIDYYATFDPSRQVEPPILTGELEGMSAILGTHDHLDHIDHDAWKIWAKTNPDAKFIFPRQHMDTVLADGVSKESALGLSDGERITIGDVTIHAIAAAHEFLDQDPETKLYPHLQYIIEGNGVRIHHAGDTVRYEGMLSKVKSFGKIDAQLLPINGRDAVRYRRNCIGNMTYQEAADFAAESEAKLVIPGHWDMFADNSADPKAFKDYIDVKYKGMVKCLIPDVMERIIVTA